MAAIPEEAFHMLLQHSNDVVKAYILALLGITSRRMHTRIPLRKDLIFTCKTFD